eukprot:6368582-Alexandrium_andersonii.AAC.1
MVHPEAGVRHAPGGGSICIRRPPGRIAGLRLKSLNCLGQPREAVGDVLRAVDLDPDRVPEA